MVLSEIVGLLKGEVHTCANKLDIIIQSACGADLMSDVMAFSKENALLLTGLINPQVVRTAEMMDIQVVVFRPWKKAQQPQCVNWRRRGDCIDINGQADVCILWNII